MKKEDLITAANKANGYIVFAKETKAPIFNEGFIEGAKFGLLNTFSPRFKVGQNVYFYGLQPKTDKKMIASEKVKEIIISQSIKEGESAVSILYKLEPDDLHSRPFIESELFLNINEALKED